MQSIDGVKTLPRPGGTESLGDKTPSSLSSATKSPETEGIPALRSGALSDHLSAGILQSMQSLNKAGKLLIKSMENSSDVSEIIGIADALSKTVSAEAKMVKSVASAVKILRGSD